MLRPLRKVPLLAAAALVSLAGGAVAEGGAPPVGGFALEGDAGVVGAWVAFGYGPDEVRGYRVDGTVLFDVVVERTPLGRPLGKDARGAHTEIRTPFYALEAVDVREGNLALTAAGAIRFTFPPDAEVRAEDGRVVVRVGDAEGAIFSSLPLSVDARSVVARQDARFALTPAGSALGDAFAEATADRRVGAVATVASGAGGPRFAAATFADVTVDARVDPAAATVTFVVAGAGDDGRVLVLRIDRALLGDAPLERVRLTFDGEPLALARDMDDALDADDDGLRPEHWVLEDADAVVVLVSVPHWSTSVYEVQAFAVAPPPAVALGLLAGLAGVAGGAVALFRRRAA